MEIDYVYLSFAVGTLIPMAVSLLTKYVAPNSVRAVINLFLSALVGALAPVLASCVETACILVPAELAPSIGMAWLASVASYHGLLNPAGVTTKIATNTKKFGVGPSQTKEERHKLEEELPIASEQPQEATTPEQGQESSNVTLLSRLANYSRNKDV